MPSFVSALDRPHATDGTETQGSDGSVVYMGLGSNMGDREQHLRAAIAALTSITGTTIVRVAPIYESEPWGDTDQPAFLNTVVEAVTSLGPEALLAEAKRVERAEGRVEGKRWGPRPLDIDFLIFGGRTFRSAILEVPHPRMWEREFVLRPLADLLPDLQDYRGRTIGDYLADWQRRGSTVHTFRSPS